MLPRSIALIRLHIDRSASLPTSVHEQQEQERQLHAMYRPRFTIDWRAEMLRLLDVPHEVSDNKLFELMGQASEKLKEVDRLRAMAKTQQSPPRAQVIHTIHCGISGTGSYLDQPWVVGNGTQIHLRASQSINNFELFLERHKEIAFIVYKQYECCNRSSIQTWRMRGELGLEIDAAALLQREHIHLLADELKTSLAFVFDTALRGISHPKIYEMPDVEQSSIKEEISHPYVWYFHGRRKIEQTIEEIPLAERRYINLFRDYIQDRMSVEWTAVDALMDAGMISAKYIEYLFVSVTSFFSDLWNIWRKLKELDSWTNRDFATEGKASFARGGLRYSKLAPTKTIIRKTRTIHRS